MDFGELCDTLVAIAGYRNYSVYVHGRRDPTGRPVLHGDFYDPDAAEWAVSPRAGADSQDRRRASVPRPDGPAAPARARDR